MTSYYMSFHNEDVDKIISRRVYTHDENGNPNKGVILVNTSTGKPDLWVLDDIVDNDIPQMFYVVNGDWGGTYHNGKITHSEDTFTPIPVTDEVYQKSLLEYNEAKKTSDFEWLFVYILKNFTASANKD